MISQTDTAPDGATATVGAAGISTLGNSPTVPAVDSALGNSSAVPTFTGLRAGFGVRDITPPIGTPNSLGVECVVEQIWDPLLATALVLEDDSTRAAIIGLDLCGLLEEPHRRIREAVAAAIDCHPDAVILNSSHTHSAPYVSSELDALLRPFGLRNTDPDYLRDLQQAVVEAAQKAALIPLETTVSAGRARVDRVGANRRPKRADGVTIHRPGRPTDPADRALPEGLIDPEVAVVAFADSPDGSPSGCIFSYSCHPTAAGGDLHGWVSADFVGAARASSSSRSIDDMPALFLEGCGGNVGTGKYIDGTPAEDVRTMGNHLANSGRTSALERPTPVTLGPLQVVRRTVPIAIEPFPPVAELERQLASAAAEDTASVVAVGDALVVARRVAEFRNAPVTVVASGDLAIVALPGEVFVEFGIAIRAGSPFPWTIVTAYNDNSLQYIPAASAASRKARTRSTAAGGTSRRAPAKRWRQAQSRC